MHTASTTCAVIAGCALALGWAAPAHAQEPAEQPIPLLPPPSRAFELKMGTGYTQGFGDVAPGDSIRGVAGAGIGVSLDADYRVNPLLSAGLETQYQEFATGRNSASRGLSTNVGVTYHFTPQKVTDPWFRLGTGYRMLWDVHPDVAPTTTNMFHGWTVATLKLGLDIRSERDVAFAPVIGADIQTFGWKDASSLSTTKIGTFIYAGLQARFDMGGHQASGVALASNRDK
jgi:hypothetical protein